MREKCYTVWVVDGWMGMEQWWNNEWVWSNGGMILTGENWSTGRKTLYSMGGRWVNEYGAVVEQYWRGKTEVVGEKHYTAWVVDEWVWSNGGMIVTGENWSSGRKTLYSVSVFKVETWTMKLNAVRLSKTLVALYLNTDHHIPVQHKVKTHKNNHAIDTNKL